jgi:hypothetical protein
MLNKTILVYYINVGNLNHEDVQEMMVHTKNNASIKNNANLTEEEKNDLIELFVPVRNQETRIEILTKPTFVTLEEEKYSALLNLVRLDNKLDRVVSYINAEHEKRVVMFEKQKESQIQLFKASR